MNAAGGDLIEVTAEGTDWSAVREDLRCHGTAVVHGRLADWRPQTADAPGLARGPRPRLVALPRHRAPRHPQPVCGLQAAAETRGGGRSCTPSGHRPGAGLRPDGTAVSARGCDQIDISLSHTDDLLLVGLTTRGLIAGGRRTGRPQHLRARPGPARAPRTSG
ncbi:hypothetical protein ACRAWF_31820 [Streptomyces sp. L7]